MAVDKFGCNFLTRGVCNVNFALTFNQQTMKFFGGVVALCRKKMGMTQAELGKRLKVSRQYVSMIESGDRSPDIGLIEQVCALSGITMGVWSWVSETQSCGDNGFVRMIDVGMWYYYGIEILRGKDGVCISISKR